MQILPAIDIKDGQAVRLFKGDFNQKTVVNPDVIEQAKPLRMRASNSFTLLTWMVLLMVVPLIVT